MAIAAGVGRSTNSDSYHAGYEACKKAMESGHIESPKQVILMASVAFAQEQIVRGAREATGNAPLVGCSAAGEITIDGPQTKSVVAMVIDADAITFTPGMGQHVKDGAREAGRALAREVRENAPEPMRAFVMFPDVLTGNGADIVRGVLDELGEHFPVVGGAAGDDFQFERTYEYLNDRVESGSVAGLGISGEHFTMGLGVRHGWVPIGLPMTVTKSEGAVVKEIDNKPAISIYEEYFEERAEDLRKEPLARTAITYPLGIKMPDLDEYLIRDPITVNDDGSITCAAEIQEGSEVRLMIGSREKAVEAATDAARKLMADFDAAGAKPKLLLMFNCIAREKLFAQKAREEIEAVMEVIGNEVPLAGFYTYGEQAPMGGELRDSSKIFPQFFNETVVMFALGE